MITDKTNNGLTEDHFMMGDAGTEFLTGRPHKIPGCAIFICSRGSAHTNIDILEHKVGEGNILLLLPGSIVVFNRFSDDLKMKYFYLSETLFNELTFKFAGDFFRLVKQNPVTRIGTRSSEFAHRLWDTMLLVKEDRDNPFAMQMTKNLLQCLFLEQYDKMNRFFGDSMRRSTRQDEIFHQFMALLRTHCRSRRDVDFYSGNLFITPRYLSFVCCRNTNLSAKKIIDLRTILEIKIMLETTKLSIQSIAEEMGFPDQSYLGRFFKRYTGESPLAYRRHTIRSRRITGRPIPASQLTGSDPTVQDHHGNGHTDAG